MPLSTQILEKVNMDRAVNRAFNAITELTTTSKTCDDPCQMQYNGIRHRCRTRQYSSHGQDKVVVRLL